MSAEAKNMAEARIQQAAGRFILSYKRDHKKNPTDSSPDCGMAQVFEPLQAVSWDELRGLTSLVGVSIDDLTGEKSSPYQLVMTHPEERTPAVLYFEQKLMLYLRNEFGRTAESYKQIPLVVTLAYLHTNLARPSTEGKCLHCPHIFTPVNQSLQLHLSAREQTRRYELPLIGYQRSAFFTRRVRNQF